MGRIMIGIYVIMTSVDEKGRLVIREQRLFKFTNIVTGIR